jgi:molybdate transport system ATP-binding protein
MLWNISIQKQYQTAKRTFALDVQLQSNAQRLVLYGPSGAGKTQLLKILAGLVEPDTGFIHFSNSVLFDRQQSIHAPPQTRRLAYMFQDYALFPHLTVVQNIGFSLTKGWLNPPRHRTPPEVEVWLEKFDLQPLADQYPHQLSGGQSQRVALARALVMSPNALLLDEPFSALDDRLRHSLREALSDLQAQLSIPMILISHNQEDVRWFGDDIVHLSQGKVVTQND